MSPLMKNVVVKIFGFKELFCHICSIIVPSLLTVTWGCFETIPSRIIFDKLQCLEFWYISQTPTRLLEKLWYQLDLFQVPESMLKNANKRWLWQFWERRWLKSQEVVQKMLLAWLSWLTGDGQRPKPGCLYSDCNQRNRENLISVKDKGIKAKMNHRR